MSIALTIFSGDGYRLSQPAPYRSFTRRVACIRGRGSEASGCASPGRPASSGVGDLL
jgi:hypothetical protein